MNIRKSMSKMSMARSSALPAPIDYLIDISIRFHLYITSIKPVEKGSNWSHMICHVKIDSRGPISVMVLSSAI